MSSLAAKFKALGDPNRLEIYQFIRRCGQEIAIDESTGDCARVEPPCVGDICCRLDVSPSTVSHHLKELRAAGLIRMEKLGRRVMVSVDQEALAAISDFLLTPLPEQEGSPVP